MSFSPGDGPGALVLDTPTTPPPGPAAPSPRRLPDLARTDLAAAVCYLAGALWITARLWADPTGRVLAANPGDQYRFESWLAHAARVLTAGENPLASASSPGLTLPLVPVTLLCGPAVAFAVSVVLALAGTALAWYWLLSRHLVTSRAAALVGGAVCGFAPGMVAQANGHPTVAAQALVPLLLWRTTRLAHDPRYPRNGLILGALAAYQALVDGEVLLITALGALVYCTVWALGRPARARACAARFLAGLGTAAALALLAYPLSGHAPGPGHGTGPGTDLAAFVAYPTDTLAGHAGPVRLAASVDGQCADLGWVLALVAVVLAVALWREVRARAAAVTGLVLGVLSLGTHPRVDGASVSAWGPWLALVHLPAFGTVVPARLALGLIPAIGLLVAVAVDRTREHGPLAGREDLRLIAAIGLVAALLPLLPTPLPVTNRPAAPRFVAAGPRCPVVAAVPRCPVVPAGHGAVGEGPGRGPHSTVDGYQAWMPAPYGYSGLPYVVGTG